MKRAGAMADVNRNRYCYAQEKLLGAMFSLAAGPGDVRARLADAYWGFHTLGEQHFPPEMQKDWAWVTAQLQRYVPVLDHKEQVRKGAVDHTMSRIKNST